jgi:hypothetical protein
VFDVEAGYYNELELPASLQGIYDSISDGRALYFCGSFSFKSSSELNASGAEGSSVRWSLSEVPGSGAGDAMGRSVVSDTRKTASPKTLEFLG